MQPIERRRVIVSNDAWEGDGGTQGKPCETYYRAMSDEDFATLQRTGRMPATAETFISPTQSFSEDYKGVLVEFKVKPGTTDELRAIGVRDDSIQTRTTDGNLPPVKKGWTQENAFFKGEGEQTNIGLGRGKALDNFNNNITGFRRVR